MTTDTQTYCEPTRLWTLTLPSGSRIEAIAVPTWMECSLVFRVNGRARRVVDCPDLGPALAYGEAVQRRLFRRHGRRTSRDD